MSASERRQTERLHRFDIFPKFEYGTTLKRGESGLVTLLGFALIAVLLFDELQSYWAGGWVSTIGVDTRGVEGEIAISLDVSFPGMACDMFGLDLMDVTGELQLGADAAIRKRATGPRGCRMDGHLRAHKVDGEFHVAFGRIAKAPVHQRQRLTATQQQQTGHVHQFTPQELSWFNASHVIHHVSFSSAEHAALVDKFAHLIGAALDKVTPAALLHPGAVDHPMDGVVHIVTHDTARFMYHIKVVPTTFVYSSGRVVHTYQISHKEHVLPIVVKPGSFRQPGVFFRYEISPYQVTVTQQSESLAHVLASCCAIIGGVFTVVGFVSHLAVSFVDFAKRQIALPKPARTPTAVQMTPLSTPSSFHSRIVDPSLLQDPAGGSKAD